MSLSKPKEPRHAIKSLFSEAQNMDIYLPAAISLRKSSGFHSSVAGTLNLSIDGLKSRTAGGFSSCGSTLPGRSSQVLSAPFGKLRRFCPIYDFSSDNSAVSRSCLQADTGVIRLQPYLRQTSLNFPKWMFFN